MGREERRPEGEESRPLLPSPPLTFSAQSKASLSCGDAACGVKPVRGGGGGGGVLLTKQHLHAEAYELFVRCPLSPNPAWPSRSPTPGVPEGLAQGSRDDQPRRPRRHPSRLLAACSQPGQEGQRLRRLPTPGLGPCVL